MYYHYFGLSENPFSIAPNPQFLYMSDRHREALAHLTFGLRESGGFVLLTGEVGTGKTTVSRCLLEQLPGNTDVAFIFNPTLTEQELLATICDDFGIAYPPTPTLKQLTDLLHQHLLGNTARGRETVLIIDEAQHLQPQVLEQLRLLTNLETNTRKLLQVILIGQPELQQLLGRRELRQLAQRITARYHLLPLTLDEVARYVSHRLAVAGCSRPLFTKAAIKRLHQVSGGVPRLLNLLCDRSLLGAYAQSAPMVDRKHIDHAAAEALLPSDQPLEQRRRWPLAGVLAVAASSLVLVAALSYAAWLVHDVVTAAPTAATATPSAKPSASLGAAANAVPGEVEPQLLNRLIGQSRELQPSLAVLFERWGLVAPQQGGCQSAKSMGHECYWREDNIDALLALGLPATVRLLDAQGQLFYATIIARQQQRLRLVMAGHELDVDAQWLRDRWQGAFVLLWSPPPGYVSPLSWTASGEAVQWLENSISLNLGEQPRRVRQFDRELEAKVRRFQQAQGLKVDGVAGVQTLIHLSRVLALDAPWLEQVAF